MTVADFRRIALSLPAAVESAHMGHPDFRVSGKIFATLLPRDDDHWGMVKLKPEQQREFIESHPGAFEPVSGGWDRKGATQIRLRAVDKATLRNALLTAWLNTAPKRVVEESGLSDAE